MPNQAGQPVVEKRNALWQPIPQHRGKFEGRRAALRILGSDQQQQLFANIAAAAQGVPREIIGRQLERFRRVGPAYAEGVARTQRPVNSDPVSASGKPAPAMAQAAE